MFNIFKRINNKDIKIEELIDSINNINDVYNSVEQIKYFAPEKYKISSAKEIWNNKKGHCFETALLAALLMEELDYKPLILNMSLKGFERENASHAVYMFDNGNGLMTIGNSRHENLKSKKECFSTIKDLVDNYSEACKEHGFDIDKWSIYDLTRSSYDWKFSKGDLYNILYQLESKTTWQER